MEDLRKNYNVKKTRKLGISKFLISNKKLIMNFIVIIVGILVIINPTMIGSNIGMWFESLISSFSDATNVTYEQWACVLITITIVTLCVKIIKSIPKK